MEWGDVPISDPESPDDELIKASADELSNEIRRRPGLAADVGTIIARRLSDTPDATTWEALRRLLVDFLGQRATGLLMWMSVHDSRDEDGLRRLQRLRDNADEEAFEFVRAIRAAYAIEFKNAWDVYGEMPHNWRLVDREVYVDVVSGRPYIRLIVTKYNGEEVVIEGTGDSFLKLAAYISLSLTTLSEPAAFSADAIDYYIDHVSTLTAMLKPPDSTAQSSAPAAV
jgi:hypothetical protein